MLEKGLIISVKRGYVPYPQTDGQMVVNRCALTAQVQRIKNCANKGLFFKHLIKKLGTEFFWNKQEPEAHC